VIVDRRCCLILSICSDLSRESVRARANQSSSFSFSSHISSSTFRGSPSELFPQLSQPRVFSSTRPNRESARAECARRREIRSYRTFFAASAAERRTGSFLAAALHAPRTPARRDGEICAVARNRQIEFANFRFRPRRVRSTVRRRAIRRGE